jgi:hypothetical protein
VCNWLCQYLSDCHFEQTLAEPVAHKTEDHICSTFCATNNREDDAMPEHEFQIYLSVLSRLMKLGEQQKAAIADELSDHLEQRFEELVRSGLGRDEAIRRALDEFGDASGLAVDLTRVSQKRIRRFIMRSSLATAALLVIGFGWMFLFPPANDALNAEPQLVAQDSSATPDAPKPSVEQRAGSAKISLDRNTSDFDAPFLRKTIAVNFADTPLVDVLEYISAQVDVPFLLDAVGLEEAGLLVDEPINFLSVTDDEQDGDADVNKIRVDQVLDLMLGEFEVTWYIEEGIVHVTTFEIVNERLINRSYDLSPFQKAGIDPGTLLEIVMQESDGAWEEVDGHGGGIIIVGDVMTIRQSYQAHREVEQILKAILNSGQPTYGIYNGEYVARLKTLQKPVSVNFVDTPLNDVIDYLSRATESRIFLDVVAIEEAGLLTDEPVSLTMDGQSLATTLRLMLAPFELTTVVRSGELFVTTIEVANQMLHSVVYDVRKIHDFQELGNAVMFVTEGNWEEVDGSGGSLSITRSGLMIVRQTDSVHRQIDNFLNLHNGRLAKPQSGIVKRKLETRFYRVPFETAEDLLTALPSSVAVDTWQVAGAVDPPPGSEAVGTIRKVAVGQKAVQLPGPEVEPQTSGEKSPTDKADEKPAPALKPQYMLVSESVLIIKQTAAVHNKIDEFLRSLDLADSALGQKLGRGGPGGGLGGGGLF